MECAAAIDILRVNGHTPLQNGRMGTGVTLADATRAKHKLTRVVQMLMGLRRH